MLKKYNSSIGYYYQQTDGIIPRNYGRDVYMRAYLRLEDGSYVYSPLYTYSVETYCNTIIDKYE